MNLFRLGEFTLHSGSKSFYKIDCDALTVDDWKTLARMIYEKVKPFRKVVGVPTGGLRLAEELKPYCFPNPEYPILIVDDVLTTGISMAQLRDSLEFDCKGAVVFARGKCPAWVKPLFYIEESLSKVKENEK